MFRQQTIPTVCSRKEKNTNKNTKNQTTKDEACGREQERQQQARMRRCGCWQWNHRSRPISSLHRDAVLFVVQSSCATRPQHPPPSSRRIRETRAVAPVGRAGNKGACRFFGLPARLGRGGCLCGCSTVRSTKPKDKSIKTDPVEPQGFLPP